MTRPRPREQGGRRDRGWERWLATGTFVVGLLCGVLLLGLLGQDPPAPTAREATAPGTAAPAGPDATTGGVELNTACLRAINAAQDIAATADDLGAAAAALDAARLDEVVRRLQPLQQRLQDGTAQCEATGALPTGSVAPTGEAVPTEEARPAPPTD
ncbi:hypothetical protein SAMN06893096_102293 [Geodermatophilus pulveris]|uniref:Uncharacterized protein n=1 Tax=Geodermatophilus pulveris TaxID=1564159 RepID=A0A239C7D2_9ACTN|nr:hypothetical protein [Geodermatophilus pulveris]SNS16165.1 hypothetical protein SAMN06893096_102293 [Geodermatophilus pulveris]